MWLILLWTFTYDSNVFSLLKVFKKIYCIWRQISNSCRCFNFLVCGWHLVMNLTQSFEKSCEHVWQIGFWPCDKWEYIYLRYLHRQMFYKKIYCERIAVEYNKTFRVCDVCYLYFLTPLCLLLKSVTWCTVNSIFINLGGYCQTLLSWSHRMIRHYQIIIIPVCFVICLLLSFAFAFLLFLEWHFWAEQSTHGHKSYLVMTEFLVTVMKDLQIS